jgi:hypothetical protein
VYRFKPEKEPPVSIGWDPEQVWTIWRSENYLTYRDTYPDPSVVQPETYIIEHIYKVPRNVEYWAIPKKFSGLGWPVLGFRAVRIVL